MRGGPRSAVLMGLWLSGVVAVMVWDLWFLLHTDAPQAWGRVVLGVGFAATAALLFNQPGQRGNACLFGALTVIWAVDQAGWRATGPLARVAMLAGGFTLVVAAAALLRFPRDRLDDASRYFLGLAAFMGASLQVGLLVTGAPPWDYLGRERAPADLVHQSSFDWLLDAKAAWWLLAAVVFLVLLVRRWLSLGALERRTVMPVVVVTAAVAGLLGASIVDPYVPDPVVRVRSLLTWYGTVGIALAFAASAVRSQLVETGITRLVNHLPDSPSIDTVQRELRSVLADKDLHVLYWVPEQAAYVRSDGRVEELSYPADRLVIDATTTSGGPLARIITDPGLTRHRDLVTAALHVSRLALENAQLEASLRAQLQAVQRARGRLLHAALEQRRQLERDLHDGAQQRLLAVGMRLGAIEATTRDPETFDAIQAAKGELHVALQELRDLAHGLYPVVLSQAGLRAALETVAEGLPISVRLSVPVRRWHPDVESAAYMVACEALVNVAKHAGPARAQLTVQDCEGELRLTVTDDGAGSDRLEDGRALGHLRDRLAALGGSLQVTSGAARGTQVVACIPFD